MRLAGRIALVALAAALVPTLSQTFVAAQPPAPAPSPSELLTATVRAVDARNRTLDLLTGVGHALRVRRVHLAPGLAVRSQGTESGLSALTPGCIVRVECRSAPTGTIASTVELLQKPPVAPRP